MNLKTQLFSDGRWTLLRRNNQQKNNISAAKFSKLAFENTSVLKVDWKISRMKSSYQLLFEILLYGLLVVLTDVELMNLEWNHCKMYFRRPGLSAYIWIHINYCSFVVWYTIANTQYLWGWTIPFRIMLLFIHFVNTFVPSYSYLSNEQMGLIENNLLLREYLMLFGAPCIFEPEWKYAFHFILPNPICLGMEFVYGELQHTFFEK